MTALTAVLNAIGCRWYVFGAQASNIWGRPRLTADVDVTFEFEGDLDACVKLFEESGFVLRTGADREFIRKTRVMPFFHPETRMFVDLVRSGPGPEEEFLDRAKIVLFDDLRVPIISPEDLLITKILAGRPKDIEDIRGVLQVRGDSLDLDRVRRILSMLEAALGQSDLTPAFEQLLADDT